MKNYFISCLLLILPLFCVSCAGQRDKEPEEIAAQGTPGESPPMINEDNILRAERGRLLLNRFSCYIVRQSLMDAGKLNPQDDCCLCKTEQQEQTVFKTAQANTNLDATVKLEQALAKMQAEKLPLISTLEDTAAFVAFWTDSIFASPTELKDFKTRRDLQKKFASFRNALEQWMITDYPAINDSAVAYLEHVKKTIRAEKKSPAAVTAVQTTGNDVHPSYWPLLLAGIACALSLITLVVAFDWKRDQKKSKNKECDQSTTPLADISKQVKSIEDSIRTLTSDIDQIKKWKTGFSEKKKSETVVQEINPSSQIADAVPLEIINTPKPLRLLFFSSPNSDGSFQNSSGRSEPIPGASIYRFELLNETTASFTAIGSNDAADLALGTPENALKPACEYLNIPPRVEQIVTNSPGSASLEGAIWRVTQKAKISFR